MAADPPSTSGLSESILDVPVDLSVELGRIQMQVRDIMGLVPGTILELDKPANEPVDLYVNGKLVACGEVVVVDNSLGIKITEIRRSAP